MKIAEKMCVVTGAAGGIGGELVRQLLARGASVAAVDLNPDALKKLRVGLDDLADNLTTYDCDISDRELVAELAHKIKKEHGHIDVLINCAGIIQPFVKVSDLEFNDIERVLDVNFYGTLYMTKEFIPHLLERPEAYLVNYSSMGGFLPVPGQSVYGASKAAVKLLTEGLYAELLNTNVHVSVVFPGATKTEIARNSGVVFSGMSGRSSNVPMLSAEKSAQIVVKGIEKNKPRIYTGLDSKMMDILYRLSPVFAVKLITRQMKSLLSE